MADEEKSNNLEEIEKLLDGLEKDFSELRGDKTVTPVTSVAPTAVEQKPAETTAKPEQPPTEAVTQTPKTEMPPTEIPTQPEVPFEAPPSETTPQTPPPETPPIPSTEAQKQETPQPTPSPQKEESTSFTDELLAGLEEPFEAPIQQPPPPTPSPPPEAKPTPKEEAPEQPEVQLPTQEPEAPPPPPVQEPELEAPPTPEMGPTPPEQPQEEFQISDEDAVKIKQKISTLSPPLKKIVKQTIINEDLPKQDLNTLLQYLLNDAPEVEIKDFIESKKGIKIEEIAPPAYRPPISRKIKPSLFDVIKHDFYPILRLVVGVAVIIYLLLITIIEPILNSHKAEKLINEGVKLIHKDDIFSFNKAEKKFKEANKLKKNFYESYIKYGNAYVYVNKFFRAEDKYLALQKINPEYIKVYFALGDMYQKEGDYKRAIKTYEEILKYDKYNIDALDRIARIYYYKLNNKKKALDIYNKIIEKDPDNIQAHYGLLSIYIWNKDLDNVEREHYQVLKLGLKKRRGRHSKILLLRIGPRKKYYIDKKRLTELADFYIEFPTDNIAKKEELLLKAEDTIKRILENDNRYSDAYYEYAKLYRMRKNYEKAIINLKNAISKKKNDARYYNLLGEIYAETGKLNLAIESFEKSIQVNPNFYKSYYNLGNINFYKLDNYEKALELYSKAAEKLKDKYTDLSYNLGWIHYNNNDYIEANKRFTDALETAPTDDPILHYAMGNTFLKLQKYDLAVDQYQNAIDYFSEKYGEHPNVNSENKEMLNDMNLLSAIYNNLGVAYLYKNNEKKALVYFWKAIESAKKLGYSNEIPQARINIQYVLRKSPGMTGPAVFDELPKKLKINEKNIVF